MQAARAALGSTGTIAAGVYIGWARRAAGPKVLVAISAAVLVGGGPAAAQEPTAVAKADAIRDTLSLPRVDQGVTMGEVVAFPIWAATLPLRLALDATAEITGFLAAQGRFGAGIDAYRYLAEHGVRPGVSTDTGLRSGVALSVGWTVAPHLNAATEVSVRGYRRHRVQWAVRPEGGTRGWGFEAAGEFRRLTQEPAWGIGLDAPTTDRADYLEDIWTAGVTVPGVWTEGRWLAVGVGWEKRTMGRGRDTATPDLVDVVDASAFPGLGGSSNFLVTSMQLTVDGVHAPRGEQPRGLRASATGTWRSGVGATDGSFGVASWQSRALLAVSSHHYLSARVTLGAAMGQRDRVPFTLLPALGGASLRSYEGGRFRDRTALSGSVEWHWELWRDLREQAHVEAYLFLDQGTVGPTISTLSDPRSSWGLGLGGRWLDELSASLYVASGGEGTRWSGAVSAEVF